MSFTGIPMAALDFYEDLEADNSKSFWTEHKPIYDEAVRAPLEALAVALSAEFGEPKIFRPYRDVRFAKDKTPYKTHQGIWFGESAVYVQISAAGLMVAGGYWHTSAPQIARLRRAVADDIAGAELERALSAVRRARLVVAGELLTRVPSAFDRDHPRAELLRYKTLTVHRELGAPPWLTTRRTQSEVVKVWRAMRPLTSWLEHHVGRD